MPRHRQSWFTVLAGIALLSLALSACGGSETPSEPAGAAEEGDEHADEHGSDEHGGDEHTVEGHMEGMHEVPEEAAAVENPIEATEESIEMGAQLYAANCAVCHGETGEGDGPGASGLDPAPANLHEEHVQVNSDGALFYIISHGVPDSPMPPWDNVLSEEERWHIVNFLRTFE